MHPVEADQPEWPAGKPAIPAQAVEQARAHGQRLAANEAPPSISAARPERPLAVAQPPPEDVSLAEVVARIRHAVTDLRTRVTALHTPYGRPDGRAAAGGESALPDSALKRNLH